MLDKYTYHEKELLLFYAMGLRTKGRSIRKVAEAIGIRPRQLYNWRYKQAGKTPLRADVFDALWQYYTKVDTEAMDYALQYLQHKQGIWQLAIDNLKAEGKL